MPSTKERQVYVGTSGWNYDAWKHELYQGLPRRRWLHHCSQRFTGIEINSTFYRLQSRATFERWRAETPDGFCFALKANRYLTHLKKLNDPLPSIRIERERALGLGDKLRATLWQLPAALKKNTTRLRRFAEALEHWPEVDHVVEFRDPSWFDGEVEEILQKHGHGVCLSDAADWPAWKAQTAGVAYARLHGHTRTYASAYSSRALQGWASWVRSWVKKEKRVHVYFDNDAEGAAPRDALRLLQLVRAANDE